MFKNLNPNNSVSFLSLSINIKQQQSKVQKSYTYVIQDPCVWILLKCWHKTDFRDKMLTFLFYTEGWGTGKVGYQIRSVLRTYSCSFLLYSQICHFLSSLGKLFPFVGQRDTRILSGIFILLIIS